MPKSMQLATVLAAAVLAACGSSPKANFYTLSSAVPPQQVPMATAPYRIAIGAVTVPDVIDRPQIVTRTGANQVTIDEFARWAEPLQGEIPRVIAANLSREVPGALVFTYPQSASMDADCRLLIEVQRFDSAPGDSATLEVLWTLRPAKGASSSGRSVAREAAGGPGYDHLVAAHGRALAAVSRDIAAAVQAVRARP
jgi:uncharacterized lipoprotein YmbA